MKHDANLYSLEVGGIGEVCQWFVHHEQKLLTLEIPDNSGHYDCDSEPGWERINEEEVEQFKKMGYMTMF